jgi:FHS family glucose/mannose:H+ symporter-like MFS transporter
MARVMAGPANTSGASGVDRAKLMAAACAGTFVFGIALAMLGAILPALFDKIGFDKAAAGNLFVFATGGMLAMTLLFGPLVDRFGFKPLLIVSALLVAAAFTLLMKATTYGLIVVAAVLMGFGGGGLNGGTNALANDIHEPAARGSALNVLGVFLGVGALTIPLLIGSLLLLLGLSNILFLAVVMSLVPLVYFALLTFPRAKQAEGFPLAEAAAVARDPLLWMCGLLLFFESANEATVAGWVSTFAQESIGATPSAAALILAGYWAMLMVGRIVASRAVGVIGSMRLVLWSTLLALGAAALVRFASSSAMATAGVVVLGFGFAAIVPTIMSVLGTAFAKFSGTVFGVAFGVGIVGGMLAPWLVGRIAQASGIREGFALPVVCAAMVVVLQIATMRLLQRRG